MQRFHYLDNSRVSECLVEDVQLAAELNGVDDEVLLSGGDLHQTGEAEETPVGVVLRRRTTHLYKRTSKSTTDFNQCLPDTKCQRYKPHIEPTHPRGHPRTFSNPVPQGRLQIQAICKASHSEPPDPPVCR